MTFKYYLTNRPPGYAHNPPGVVEQECWMPKKSSNDPKLTGWTFFGWVSYQEQLAFHQIWSFELTPVDLLERTRFWIWKDNDKDQLAAEAMIADYASLGLD